MKNETTLLLKDFGVRYALYKAIGDNLTCSVINKMGRNLSEQVGKLDRWEKLVEQIDKNPRRAIKMQF